MPLGYESRRRLAPRLRSFARLAGWVILIILPFLAYRLAMLSHGVVVELQRPDLPPIIAAKLSRVIDGDTIEVFIQGRRERVQLLGVDGPELFRKETKQENGRMETEWVQVDDPQAAIAQKALTQFMQGKPLTLEFNGEEDQLDRYGRLLAWVWVRESDGTRVLVNEWLIRQGLAKLRLRGQALKYRDLLQAAAASE